MNKIEILAPVGSAQVLEAAVYSGADAVYLGTQKFSARESAGNFSFEELEQAVKFCHVRDVKVFVALNTLFKDTEIPQLMETVEYLCKIAVDAIIVQDMGLFYLLKKCCPNMPVHCSTQMSLSSKSAVKLVENLGAKRAVLAREMSLAEISEIKQNSDVELEVFVHGALCMCISGQCYFSAMLGSRSGNRGRCAQTCRLPFSSGNIENALSLKDLGYIDNIKKLEEIGVNSAKIEGRMKRPEYVAAATNCAKSVATVGVADFQIRENLQAVFSRSGFTTGYLDGKLGRDMFGIRTKQDVEKGGADVFAELHNLYRTELQKVKINIEAEIFADKQPVVTAYDNLGNRVQVIGADLVQTARNRPLSEQDIQDRLAKFGGTPYLPENICVKTDGVSILPASQINALRREIIEKLNNVREQKSKIDFNYYNENLTHRVTDSFKLRGEFRSFTQVPENISMFEYIFIPLSAPINEFEILQKRCTAQNVKLGVVMPYIIFGKDEQVKTTALELQKIGINEFACGNLYAVQLVKEISGNIHGKYSLNALNSYAVKQFEEIGLSSLEMSFEIRDIELANIKSQIPRGLMIYGRQTLMLTRNCPVKETEKDCATCKSARELTDRKGVNFPVVCSKYKSNGVFAESFDHYSEILNSTPLCLQDRLKEVRGADFGVLRFTVENSVEIVDILDDVLRQKNTRADYTRGLFYRGVL